MSLRNIQKKSGKGGALVLASMPAVAGQANGDDLRDRNISPQTANRLIVATRSVFLAQLAGQYESKSAASARRMDARASASSCYSKKSPKPRLRHLVWV